MDAPDPLEQLLVEWELGQGEADPPTPEALCRDRPEYLVPLKELIRRLREADGLLSLDRPEAGAPSPDDTPDPDEALPELPGHRVVKLLKAGGMGKVYLARHLSLKRHVVVKMLKGPRAADAQYVRRFEREAQVLFDLRHPHIVRLYEARFHEGQPYFTMDFLKRGSLKGHLSDYRGRPEKAARLLEAIARAVHFAHEQGVLHRDLKPDNILLGAGDEPVVSDFGIAKIVEAVRPASPAGGPAALLEGEDPGETVTRLTRDGAFVGTPAYMAPEQFSEQAEGIGRATDVWALGVILFEAVHGEHPFLPARPGELPWAEVRARITRAEIRWPTPDPGRRQRRLRAVIARCLRPDPGDRYPTALRLADDLRAWLDGGEMEAAPDGPVRRAWRWAKGTRAGRALGVVLMLGVLVALGVGAIHLLGLVPAGEDSRKVAVVTDPPGARVALVPIDPSTGEFRVGEVLRSSEASPVTFPRVPPGEYLLVAEKEGHGFHEVYRTVPPRGVTTPISQYRHTRWQLLPDGTVELHPVVIPPASVAEGMAPFDGGLFVMGRASLSGSEPHRREVLPFLLDPTEVTVGQYRAAGNLLPPGLRGGQHRDDEPVRFVNHEEAAEYAEEAGKRLPDEAEYEFAATGGGARAYPWGNDAGFLTDWEMGPVGTPAYDRVGSTPPVHGLYSNVAEWTASWNLPYPTAPAVVRARVVSPEYAPVFLPDRVVRGAPFSVVLGRPEAKELPWGPRLRYGVNRSYRHPGLGFRCARSQRPRFLDE